MYLSVGISQPSHRTPDFNVNNRMIANQVHSSGDTCKLVPAKNPIRFSTVVVMVAIEIFKKGAAERIEVMQSCIKACTVAQHECMMCGIGKHLPHEIVLL